MLHILIILICNQKRILNLLLQQVELSFKTGEVILVYGEMDEDGFFMGELDGVRGLVPSNFLTEAPEQYNNQVGPGSMSSAQRNPANRGRGQGPGARGPPPPPRENMGATGMGPMNQMGQMSQMNQMGQMNQMNQMNQMGQMNQRGQLRKGKF